MLLKDEELKNKFSGNFITNKCSYQQSWVWLMKHLCALCTTTSPRLGLFREISWSISHYKTSIFLLQKRCWCWYFGKAKVVSPVVWTFICTGTSPRLGLFREISCSSWGISCHSYFGHTTRTTSGLRSRCLRFLFEFLWRKSLAKKSEQETSFIYFVSLLSVSRRPGGFAKANHWQKLSFLWDFLICSCQEMIYCWLS